MALKVFIHWKISDEEKSFNYKYFHDGKKENVNVQGDSKLVTENLYRYSIETFFETLPWWVCNYICILCQILLQNSDIWNGIFLNVGISVFQFVWIYNLDSLDFFFLIHRYLLSTFMGHPCVLFGSANLSCGLKAPFISELLKFCHPGVNSAFFPVLWSLGGKKGALWSSWALLSSVIFISLNGIKNRVLIIFFLLISYYRKAHFFIHLLSKSSVFKMYLTFTESCSVPQFCIAWFQIWQGQDKRLLWDLQWK